MEGFENILENMVNSHTICNLVCVNYRLRKRTLKLVVRIVYNTAKQSDSIL